MPDQHKLSESTFFNHKKPNHPKIPELSLFTITQDKDKSVILDVADAWAVLFPFIPDKDDFRAGHTIFPFLAITMRSPS